MSIGEKPRVKQPPLVEQVKEFVYPQSLYVRRNRGVIIWSSLSAMSFGGFLLTSGHDFIETFPEVLSHASPTSGQAIELVSSFVFLGISLLALHSARRRRKTY